MRLYKYHFGQNERKEDMATIQEVAKMAKVGVATVSRVINKTGYVKEETRERIENAIKELNYTPNAVARNLYRNKNGIVAVIIPEIDHPFFSAFVNELEEICAEHKYKMMLCNTWFKENYEYQYLEMLNEKLVDGIVVASHTLDIEQYASIDRPVVALDRDLGEKIPCVRSDHEAGGRMAALELIAAGCKKVAQFRNSEHTSAPFVIRHDTFEDVLREHGVEYINIYTEWNTLSYEYNRILCKDFFTRYPDVDGVFATDILALNIEKEALKAGISIPERLKIVAYDGTALIDFAHPSITVVEQPIKELAKECFRQLDQRINGEELKRKIITLPVEMKKGMSTSVKRT